MRRYSDFEIIKPDDLKIDIRYIGLIDEMFKYHVTLTRGAFTWSTEYSTGIGWAKTSREVRQVEKEDGVKYYVVNMDERAILERLDRKFRDLSVVYREAPHVDSMLSCLILDAECGQYTHYEFCDNLGYSRDSIEHMSIYLSCQKTADAIRKLGIKRGEEYDN